MTSDNVKVVVKETEPFFEGPIFRLIIGLIVAISFLVGGALAANKAAKLAKNGVEAQGVVVSTRVVKRKRSSRIHPTVEFKDAKGETHKKEMGSGSYNQGDQVSVIYLPDNPKVADISSPTATSPVFGYIMMGLSLIGWGMVAYNGFIIMGRRRQSQ